MNLSIPFSKTPKALDPFWQYGEFEDGTNQRRLHCKLCGQHMIGGFSRLKYHLDKILGHDVGPCTAVTPEIIRFSHESINENDRKKKEIVVNKVEFVAFGLTRSLGVSVSAIEGSGRGSIDSPTGRASSFFVPCIGVGAQPSIKSIIKKREMVEANRVLRGCLFWSDLPLIITKKNPFWQLMCDAIAIVGPRYKSVIF